jgi:hypothetical protein
MYPRSSRQGSDMPVIACTYGYETGDASRRHCSNLFRRAELRRGSSTCFVESTKKVERVRGLHSWGPQHPARVNWKSGVSLARGDPREKQRGITIRGIVGRTIEQRASGKLFPDILQSNSRTRGWKRRARSPPRVKRRRASEVFFHFGLEPTGSCVFAGRFRSRTADELWKTIFLGRRTVAWETERNFVDIDESVSVHLCAPPCTCVDAAHTAHASPTRLLFSTIEFTGIACRKRFRLRDAKRVICCDRARTENVKKTH